MKKKKIKKLKSKIKRLRKENKDLLYRLSLQRLNQNTYSMRSEDSIRSTHNDSGWETPHGGR